LEEDSFPESRVRSKEGQCYRRKREIGKEIDRKEGESSRGGLCSFLS